MMIMPSDVESSLLDEVTGLFQLGDVAPELLLHGGVVWPLCLSCFVVQGAVLQDVLWGLGRCLARAEVCVGQTQAAQVLEQAAVSTTQSEDGDLLLAIQ